MKILLLPAILSLSAHAEDRPLPPLLVAAARVLVQPSLRASDVLAIPRWVKILPATSERLEIPDDWMGDNIFGVTFDPSAAGVVLTDAQKRDLAKAFNRPEKITTEQEEPWEPVEIRYYVVLNSQNRAIFVIERYADTLRSVTITQVIQVEKGKARFSFGDEDFLRIEAKLKEDMKVLPE